MCWQGFVLRLLVSAGCFSIAACIIVAWILFAKRREWAEGTEVAGALVASAISGPVLYAIAIWALQATEGK